MFEIIDRILNQLPLEIDISNRQFEERERRYGGYFCYYDVSKITSPNFPPDAIIKVGNLVLEEANDSFNACQEKAHRLLINPHHLSSWQSQSEEKGQRGGAIRTKDLILSFHGLKSEGADEAVLVNICVVLKLIDQSIAQSIASYSGNQLINI